MIIANTGSTIKESTLRGSGLIFQDHGHGRHTAKHGGQCPVCQTECGWESGHDVVWCAVEDKGRVEAPQEGPGMAWIKSKRQGSHKNYISYSLADTQTAKTETQAQREDRLALAAYNKRQADKERAHALKQLPSNETRDAYYRSVLRPLESVDLEDLIKRGMTADEILNAETLGFLGRGPRQTSRTERSFLILSHFDGEIVGGQIATAYADRKYIWDNHEFTTHLQGIGSAPHMECASIKLIPNTAATTVVVVEGFLKALVTAVFAAREGLDWYVMGVAGSSFLGGITLANRIAELKIEFPGIKVTIAPDGDMATNEHVYKSYKPAVTESSHYDGVLWFGQAVKGQNIDDVSAERRASAKVVSVAKYWKTIKDIQDYAKVAHIERYNDATEARKQWFGETGVVLDRSVCGSGKSYTARAVADQMQAEGLKLAIIDNRYRNADALEGLTLIQGRHTGLVRDNGNTRTIKFGEDLTALEIVAPSNCFQAASIAAQTAKGMFNEGETAFQKVCLTCPLFKECSKGDGQDDKGRGFGYLKQREALEKQNVVAMHPRSMPEHTSEWYQTSRHFIFDESASLFSRCIDSQTISVDDLGILSLGLSPDSAGQSAVRTLHDLIKKAALSRYGLNMQDLQELLTIKDEALTAIEEYLQTEQTFLARLDYATDREYLEAINRRMASNFVSPLRQIIAGTGTATATSEGITLATPSGFGLAVSNANMVLTDATADPEEVSAMLGGVKIHETMSQTKDSLPKIVKILGNKYTTNRSQGMRSVARHAAEEITAAHKKLGQTTAIVDMGRFMDDYKNLDAVKMRMHVDNVGSNRAKDCNALVIVGTPRPNITAYKATWEILSQQGYGRDFDHYYKMKCAEMIHQTIHRLRPNRRPNEELTVYILDGSYEGHCDAEVTLEALLADKATGKAQKVMLIQNALASMDSNGEDGKVSLRKIGELTGISHTHVATLLPQAIALMGALRLDEVIESLHAAGVESEEELTAVINEIILSAIGATDNEDELDEGEDEGTVYEYQYDGLITA